MDPGHQEGLQDHHVHIPVRRSSPTCGKETCCQYYKTPMEHAMLHALRHTSMQLVAA